VTTKRMDRRAELQAAVTHVERVLEDLNVEFGECNECGMKHYDNFADWQCFTRLESVVQSLQKQINNLPQSRGNEGNDNGTQGKSSGGRV